MVAIPNIATQTISTRPVWRQGGRRVWISAAVLAPKDGAARRTPKPRAPTCKMSLA